MNAKTDELFRLVRLGEVTKIANILENDKSIEVNCTRWSGFSLLHRAAELGMTDICEVLVHYGASVKLRSTRGWYTPLHIALANGYIETAMFLVDNGANPWSKSKYKEDPFEYGAKRGFRKVSEEFRMRVMKVEMNMNLKRHHDLLKAKTSESLSGDGLAIVV